MSDRKIGEILLEMDLLSPDQLEEAIKEHAAKNLLQTLGRTLVKLGYVSEETLQKILDEHDKRLSFAETLIKYNYISRDDLAIAAEMSANEHLPLDRIIQNLEFMTEEGLAKAMAHYSDRPFVHLDNRPVNIKESLFNNIVSLSSEYLALVPVSMEGQNMTIAMNRMLPVKKLEQIEGMFQLKVDVVIAAESEIRQAQARFAALSGNSTDPVHDPELSDSIMDILASDMDADEDELEATRVTEKDSLMVKLVNKIICDAYHNKASDIHIEPGQGREDILVRTRIDGVCTVSQRLPYKFKYALPSRIKIMADLDISDRRKPQDGKIIFKKYGPLDIELRVATMPAVGQLEDVVIRILQSGELLGFGKLMLTPRNMAVFERAIRMPYGLVLVVGPTGSGKTTTLHSAIGRINTPEVKILTAEDPVEITQKGLRQLQVNPRIGLTFASALRAMLRLDPDIIMVGEMRDVETSAIAVEASLTGHLVFSTLHTNSAPETVTRLLDMGLDPFSFSDSLLCILAQRLVRTLCRKCKETYKPGKEELDKIIEEYGAEAFTQTGINRDSVTLARPTGCSFCQNTGYKGRIGVHEVLECTEAMKILVKKKVESSEIRRLSIAEGMTTLKQDGILKVLQGITDLREIRKVCIH